MPSPCRGFSVSSAKRVGVVDDKRFFKRLIAESDYQEDKIVKIFYFALVRVIMKDLRDHGVAYLPHVGYFYIRKSKPQTLICEKRRVKKSLFYRLSFCFVPSFKRYFINFFEARAGNETIALKEKAEKDKTEEELLREARKRIWGHE